MANLTAAERKVLKGRGIISTKDENLFIARIITVNGVITNEQMAVITEAAKKYGNGSVALTTRLTVEVQGLTYENIDAFTEMIGSVGLVTGGTGGRVRPIVACKGTVCVHGLADTQALAAEIHETFYKGWYDVKLPHKFKIGIGGCPNNCIKPSLNDLGIVAQQVPVYDPDDCNGCRKCGAADVCPIKAAKLVDGVMQIDPQECNNCGKCINACHFDCITAGAYGFKLYVGGYWGKRQRPGTPVDLILSKEEVFEYIERCILLYREQGKTGERFGMFIDRIGVDNFVAQLKAGDVMARKQAILDANLHTVGGATC